MDTNTIVLLIGFLMIFIGIFGGGFEIKEIKIPKVNVFSRLAGFLVGAFFVIWGLNFFPATLPDLSDKPEEIVNNDPKESPGIDDVNKIWDELENGWKNPDFENDFLLKEYIKLDTAAVKQQLSFEIRNTLTKRIEALQNSINAFEMVKTNDKTDTLTLIQKRDLWKDFKTDRYSTQDENLLDEQQEKYKLMINSMASLVTPDNFVTCLDVKGNKPIGIGTQFNPGKVWVWARVNAPKNEVLMLEWVTINNNEIIKKTDVRVNKSSGYRTHFAKSFSDVGRYEVRLFNGEHHLIGRRSFQIN